jgi:hypothetical protein
MTIIFFLLLFTGSDTCDGGGGGGGWHCKLCILSHHNKNGFLLMAQKNSAVGMYYRRGRKIQMRYEFLIVGTN